MDKGDWALLISMGSFLVAGASAFYTRRMAIQDAMKMARKSPIMEVTHSAPMTAWDGSGHVPYPGYFEASITVRNLEPSAGLRLISITGRGKQKLAFRESFHDPNTSMLGYRLLPNPPADALKQTLEIDTVLQVYGTARPSHGVGDTRYLSICSTSAISPKSILLDWKWLDGAKR